MGARLSVRGHSPVATPTSTSEPRASNLKRHAASSTNPSTAASNSCGNSLYRFARNFPAVRLDASISANLDLPALIKTGDLDLAVVISLRDPDNLAAGRLLRRTRLVWVVAETFEPPRNAPLPFAFYPPCVHRQVGVRALGEAGIDSHIVFTSHSQESIRAAVLAGLAISAIACDDIEDGMRIIDGEYGLPPLPDIDFALVWSSGGKTPASTAFGELICEMA